jgi:3-phenylpropionate/trans-cinnamate dioxygenase ferredoxin subunit
MSEDDFVPSINENEINDGAMKLVNVVGRAILLVRVGSQVFGVSNRCPHLGCSLSNGTLKEYTVTCPCHGWSFDVRNGQYLKSKEVTLLTYECKIQDGKVQVKIMDL